MSRPATLGDLRASGWVSQPIKEELRANTVRVLAKGEPLIDGVIGYEDTVIPQLANALLAGHDIVFLGERGQAKFLRLGCSGKWREKLPGYLQARFTRELGAELVRSGYEAA